MGRAFERRKERKFKNWGNMSRMFTKLGREIEIAVKSGGADPDYNPRLRVILQTARSENMPKDNIERAIKRASSHDTSGYKEMVYEGYGPHSIAIVVETATDNPTRTVANVRRIFNWSDGSLGTSGSLDFVFDRKCVFTFSVPEEMDVEELELELIDYDVDELYETEEGKVQIYAPFRSYGNIQEYLEESGFKIASGEFERVPKNRVDVTPEQRETIDRLIEKFQEDDDVTNVFTNMKEEDEE